MTEAEFLAARDLMAEALARAKSVIPYFSGREETARVELFEDGKAAVLSWSACGDYDGGSALEDEYQYFPRHLLFCSEAEVLAWKAAEKKAADEKSAEYRRSQIAQNDANERAMYAALKAKFETSSTK